MRDLISRQAAIKAIGNLYPDMPKIEFLDNRSLWRQKYEQYINAQQTIRDLPSVPVNYGSTNLIDRQAAIDAISQRLDALKGLRFGTSTFWDGLADGYARIMSDLQYLPTVDAVHVVRCKDCKYHKDEEPGMVWCGISVAGWVSENGYCSDGKRRDDAEVH